MTFIICSQSDYSYIVYLLTNVLKLVQSHTAKCSLPESLTRLLLYMDTD